MSFHISIDLAALKGLLVKSVDETLVLIFASISSGNSPNRVSKNKDYKASMVKR